MMLPWLPVHEDLPQALRSARALPESVQRFEAARYLAGFNRDLIATVKIDRLASGLLNADQIDHGLSPFRLAVLGSHSVDHLVPAIRVAGLNHGQAIEVHVGGYGLYREALLRGDRSLEAFAPQALLLSLDMGTVIPRLPLRSSERDVQDAVDEAMQELRSLWKAAHERLGARVLQQTFISQVPSVAGSNEWLLPASPTSIQNRLNSALQAAAERGEVLLLDLGLCAICSTSAAPLYDPARWFQAKQLVNPAAAPRYGEITARLLAALAGRSRKCLVLDLDNTLWGGVIGDCGVEGIALGQGSAAGEAHLAFQTYVSLLRERGVVLAVCSKNDEVCARAAFDRHPDMQISFEHVACFMANWSDKATNLRMIAKKLDLGLDSFVFVDDNPAERDIIRRELPEVAVPEMPEDVSLYPAVLAAAGYFESVSMTTEDFRRSEDYSAANQRRSSLEAVTDIDSYLASLQMRLSAAPLGAMELPRAAQLINKSNQFNLTTRRRTEAELAALVSRAEVLSAAFRLTDRFSDSGLISVLLLRPDPAFSEEELLIDTWLMSCRVLGRGVEQAVLEWIVAAAKSRGAKALIGQYIPTQRNGMVAAHYESLGFQAVEQQLPETSGRLWRLPIADFEPPGHYIQWELVQ